MKIHDFVRILLATLFMQRIQMKPFKKDKDGKPFDRTNIYMRDRETQLLTEATSNIVQTFYVKRTSSIFITRCSVRPSSNHRQSQILNRLLLSTHSQLTYVIEEPKYVKPTHNLRYNNIFLADTYDGFR